ncbi:unnamed protein product [Phaeothamnion confervicola]
MSIPMEKVSRPSGVARAKGVAAQADADGRGGGAGGATAAAATPIGSSPAPGRRLPGASATLVRVPAAFRHRMSRLPGHHAAVVRQWEEGLTRQRSGGGAAGEDGGLMEGRIFFCGSKGYPLAVLSVIRYEPKEEEARRRRQRWADARGAEAGAAPSSAGAAAATAAATASPEEPAYLPGFLDDPNMTTGRHRHVMKGHPALGPVVCSVLLFVKPRELKEELNRQFRERHPSLPPSLTLSKIRALKRQALLGCYRAGIEVSTVALACVFLERLCLKGIVTKANRRLSMACCLVLAYKFNEPLISMETQRAGRLPALWAFMDQEWQISRKEIFEAEFGALVQLGFSLHVDPHLVNYHFTLLLKQARDGGKRCMELLAVCEEGLPGFFPSRRVVWLCALRVACCRLLFVRVFELR